MSMVKRCIMIFPELDNIEIINEIRTKYDPLVNHVRPHITLVFPFESNINTDDLRKYMENTLSSIKSFELVLKYITPSKSSFGNYLFLNIKEGKGEIKEIHKKLYQNILKTYKPSWLSEEGSYNPHMTVGVIKDEKEFELAVEKTEKVEERFNTIVDKISVEIIDDNEDSIIEFEIKLKSKI